MIMLPGLPTCVRKQNCIRRYRKYVHWTKLPKPLAMSNHAESRGITPIFVWERVFVKAITPNHAQSREHIFAMYLSDRFFCLILPTIPFPWLIWWRKTALVYKKVLPMKCDDMIYTIKHLTPTYSHGVVATALLSGCWPWLHDGLWPVFNVCFPCWTMSNHHLKAVWNLITGLPLSVG